MKAVIDISDNTISAPIRPYPDRGIIPTQLYTASILAWNQEMDFYTFQQQRGSLTSSITWLEITHNSRGISLPHSITNQLLTYLQAPKYGEKFDCHKFIEYISGEISHVLLLEEFSPEKANVWDICYVYDDLWRLTHGEIYLWDGLFLSKWGNAGPLIISTSKSMETLRWWKATFIKKS